jgi:hypothetical protein
MSRTIAIVVAFLALAAGAATAGPSGSGSPTELIGMDPAQAFAALGAPAGIFTQRGTTADEDDVVFFYPDFRYVFWFGNRVWQVSYDRRYAGTVLGFSIGMGRAEAEAAAPGRLQESGGSLFLSVDTGRFPLRVRLAMAEGRVTDIYVYRSDW